MEEEKTDVQDKECIIAALKKQIEKELEVFTSAELKAENLDALYKLVDIAKDLENIDYWKVKKEAIKMRYNDYSDGYSEGRYGNYGRRGVPGTGRGRYRDYSGPEETLHQMQESYSAYADSKAAYSRGNYGAKDDGLEALNDTMSLFVDFSQKMLQEIDSPEAKQVIKKHLKKIGEISEMM